MENFKLKFGLLLILGVLLSGCDPIYNTQSETLVWEINKVATEAIQIDARGTATLGNGTITTEPTQKNQRLLLMITYEIPTRSVLNELYGMSLDSLAKNNYIFDTRENGFYSLGLLDLDQDTIHFRLDRPVSGTKNYIVGIPSDSTLKVQINLEFQKMADTLRPTAKIISLGRN